MRETQTAGQGRQSGCRRRSDRGLQRQRPQPAQPQSPNAPAAEHKR